MGRDFLKEVSPFFQNSDRRKILINSPFSIYSKGAVMSTSNLFYNNKSDAAARVTNAMWHAFGVIDDGRNLVQRFGNEPTYYEWMSEKLAWSGERDYIDTLKSLIQHFPQTSTGYMWSWSTFPYWKVDECYSIHYDGTFRYIAAVYDIVAWEGNTDFLWAVDQTADTGVYAACDASKGRTVWEKTQACMSYILDYLHGKDGYILLDEASTYLTPDGSKRFDYVVDTGEYCWNNTGRPNSHASNYWDNLPFGHKDAYTHALLYNVLPSMAGLYRMVGGEENLARAEALDALRPTVKKTFNDRFWSEATGRYIACIDVDGNPVDYGFTFVNFEAMKYGLADEDRARRIFDWIDGRRTVEGDTVTGEKILSYGDIIGLAHVPGDPIYDCDVIRAKGLRLAAITNTVSITDKGDPATGRAWWHAPSGIRVFDNARYGTHLENGGYIFYPVFYELMARAAYLGADATVARLNDIAKVYDHHGLKSNAAAVPNGAAWMEGLNTVFPENGLVPTAYFYGLMGVSAAYDGLHIAPKFGSDYEHMGVHRMVYGGHAYGVEVHRDGTLRLTALDGVVHMSLHYTPDTQSDTYAVTIVREDGTIETATATSDANREIHLSWDHIDAVRVEISPIKA